MSSVSKSILLFPQWLLTIFIYLESAEVQRHINIFNLFFNFFKNINCYGLISGLHVSPWYVNEAVLKDSKRLSNDALQVQWDSLRIPNRSLVAPKLI